jgi:nucleotide-binding universal stress UspA family protein
MEQIIICPTDFSKCSDQALHFASEIVHLRGGRLIVVHVTPASEGAVERSAGERSGVEPARLPSSVEVDVPCEYVGLIGDTAAEIVRFAREAQASQIVMGTHGRRRNDAVRMGRTAARVVHRASCPVTVVKNEGIEQMQDRPPS